MTYHATQTRRDLCKRMAGGVAAATLAPAPRLFADEAKKSAFRFDYILASCMYGTTKLAEILPEVKKIGATHIDIWPRVHGNQREQVAEMGVDRFAELLAENDVKLGMFTQYKLGPFRLQGEMEIVKKLGGRLLIAGSTKQSGKDIRGQVKAFVEKMRPHIAAAEKHGLTIGIENHGGALIKSPDSMRWLVEFAKSKHIGIALAPYHLPSDPKLLAKLIEDLGPGLAHFYAWEHGMGCSKKLPKEQELMQMPGRGKLDFKPVVAALKKIDYKLWTEIFMHPVPRGIPILEKTISVTAEINRSRKYLESLT